MNQGSSSIHLPQFIFPFPYSFTHLLLLFILFKKLIRSSVPFSAHSFNEPKIFIMRL